MLDLMRRHARSWIIKIALGGIIIVFIFWYGWSGPRDKSRTYVADVNGTVITEDHFRAAYDTELEKIRMRFQGNMPQGLLDKLNLKKAVAQALINQTLLLQEAQRLGLFVTDVDLVNDIRSNPMFARDGVFDEGAYRAYLNAIKMNPTSYEHARKNELLAQQVVDLLTDSAKTNPEEVKTFWHFQSDKLYLSILLVKAGEQQASTPDPKALEAYYKEHQSKYEIPPMVTVQFVAFSWRDAAKQLSVSDEEAKSYFANHPKEFVTPEQIHASHILIKVPPNATKEQADEALKKIEDIRNKIKVGEAFATVAQKDSQDESTAEKGGDLGFLSRNSLHPQLENAAAKLEPGQISEPVRTEQGYHLLTVLEKKPETQLDFEVSKEKIVEKLLEEKARKKAGVEADEFYEKVYRTEDLDGPAKEFGFSVKKAGPVSKAGGIQELGADSKIMDEAFQLRVGEVSRLLQSGDNYVVMKLVEKHKERIPTLDEVRNLVVQDYAKHQSMVSAEKKATEIIEALKQPDADPQAVAKKFELTWEDLAPVSRTANFISALGSGAQVSEMLTTLSTALPLYPSPVAATDGVAVVRLVKTETASDEQFAREAAAIEKWVLEVRQAEFLKGWLKVMAEKSKIDLNEKYL
ncbi:MAG TPA: SurA N-terminal domain-containing protein [Desulfomonilaceae bacterium]|nr:SurA N-terminal domain-containing protein [Desulfomonilaceae bacterium]